jgi:hypothetical protein
MSGSISYDIESEVIVSGSITAAGQSVEFNGPNTGTETLQITGTWVGNIVVEATNGTVWETLKPLKVDSALFVTSITSNGLYLIQSNGYVSTRIRSTAWTSGTANILNKGSDHVSVAHVQANLNSGQLVPTITNKLRIRTNTGVNVVLPATNAYQTLYTRTGTGLFFGFQAGFNNDKVNLRLTIDSGTVFTLSLDEIRTFQFNDTSTTRCQAGSFLTTIGNTLDFSSRFAIPYETSLLIEAASNNSIQHTCTTWMSIHTEDS